MAGQDIEVAERLGEAIKNIQAEDGGEFPGPEPPELPPLPLILGTNITVFDDHVLVNNTFPIMRARYFQEKLEDLDDFDGFAPRWILPRTQIHSPENGLNATQIMIILDTAWEVKVGVAPNFPPTILGSQEIMIQESVAEYLDIDAGSEIYFKFNLSDYTNNT